MCQGWENPLSWNVFIDAKILKQHGSNKKGKSFMKETLLLLCILLKIFSTIKNKLLKIYQMKYWNIWRYSRVNSLHQLKMEILKPIVHWGWRLKFISLLVFLKQMKNHKSFRHLRAEFRVVCSLRFPDNVEFPFF